MSAAKKFYWYHARDRPGFYAGDTQERKREHRAQLSMSGFRVKPVHQTASHRALAWDSMQQKKHQAVNCLPCCCRICVKQIRPGLSGVAECIAAAVRQHPQLIKHFLDLASAATAAAAAGLGADTIALVSDYACNSIQLLYGGYDKG